jgi:cell division protein YceG involved in septum cleavage
MLKPNFRISIWFLLGVAALVAVPAYSHWVFARPGPLAREASVLIKKGTTISQATEILFDKGIIDSKRLFLLRAKIGGPKIIRGEYIFPAKSSMASVWNKLTKGMIHTTKLVITPALHGWLVQKRLEPFIPENKFWSMWENPELIRQTGFPDAPSLEGLIAPATYSLNLAMEPEEIILEMV